jgi:hypothetical protein
MCNDRTEFLRGEKEWPDALRRRAGRIVPAHKFKLSQYQLVYRRGSVSKQVPKRAPATNLAEASGDEFEVAREIEVKRTGPAPPNPDEESGPAK